MLVWLGAYICYWLYFYVSSSDCLAPSATALSKTSTMVQMFSLINILNFFLFQHKPCSVCSQARTYEINYILTSSFLLSQTHKIKIAETGQLAVGIRALDCKYIFLSFLKMLTALTTGSKWKRRVREKN